MQQFTPKLITALREGYSLAKLRADAMAGLTVAIIALPLAMALGIASGASPDKGLITAVVAGFLISALGGSRLQIGGPTGAFVVVVFTIIAKHGYDGLIIATLMAGIILIIAGYAKFGQMIKFIPHPVITGFTAGIAVIIASSQVKDFFGLSIASVPAEFLAQWQMYFSSLSTLHPITLAVGFGVLAVIIGLRKYSPRLPGFLIAIVLASIVVSVLQLSVDTVGSRFPQMSSGLAMPVWPDFSIVKIQEMLPSAFTIAFLAGIEALLSAVVADGMTGTRHRSNQELVGQGFANIASALFGGLPATGAIARTATNIKSGAQTPVAGILHAAFLLLFILFAANLMAYVPMAALAAILFIVAWGMSEYKHFIHLLSMPNSDRGVLLLTFGLTVFVDLTVAIGVGVTVASLLFMARMSETVQIENGNSLLPDADQLADEIGQRDSLPNGVEVFRITGPFFFGVAGELLDTLRRVGQTPKVIILRMRLVPMLDASGVSGVAEFISQAQKSGAKIIFSGVQEKPKAMLARGRISDTTPNIYFADNYSAAIIKARLIIDSA